MIKLIPEEKIKEFLAKTKEEQATTLLNYFHKNLTESGADFYIKEFYKKYAHPTINNFCEFFGMGCTHEEEDSDSKSIGLDLVKELYEELLQKIGRDGIFLTPREFYKWCEVKVSENSPKSDPIIVSFKTIEQVWAWGYETQIGFIKARTSKTWEEVDESYRIFRKSCGEERPTLHEFAYFLFDKHNITYRPEKKEPPKEKCKCKCKQSDTLNAPNGTHMSDEQLLEKISEAIKHRKMFGIESNVVAALTLLDNMLDDRDQNEFDEIT